MSIALESSTSDRIQPPALRRGMLCGSAYDSPEVAADRRLKAEEDADSSSSSTIGQNSDSLEGEAGGDSGEGDAQSSYKGPLEALDALEGVLPIKRSLSKFYCGKSKSFTSLGDAASCSSTKEIVKPENAYTRKRKNLLAHSILCDKDRNYIPRSCSSGVSKRLANSSRSILAMTMSIHENNNNCESSNSNSSPIQCRPPLYPHGRRSSKDESSLSPQHNLSPWRSFSLSDLQSAAAATPGIPGIVISNGGIPGIAISNGEKDKLQ